MNSQKQPYQSDCQSDCQFEWFSHEAEARKAGLSAESIETLRYGGDTFQAADEQAIHDYATELLQRHHTGEPTYQRILADYGTAGIVELTALIGYYSMVALTLSAHEIGVPDGATPPLPALPGHGTGV
jgi:4-carboxymuconolactone decarboxylase